MNPLIYSKNINQHLTSNKKVNESSSLLPSSTQPTTKHQPKATKSAKIKSYLSSVQNLFVTVHCNDWLIGKQCFPKILNWVVSSLHKNSGKYNHNFVICFYHFGGYRLSFMYSKNPIQNYSYRNLEKTQPTFGCFHHFYSPKPSYTCCAKSGAVTSSPPLKIRVTAAKVLRHATLPRWPGLAWLAS